MTLSDHHMMVAMVVTDYRRPLPMHPPPTLTAFPHWSCSLQAAVFVWSISSTGSGWPIIHPLINPPWHAP